MLSALTELTIVSAKRSTEPRLIRNKRKMRASLSTLMTAKPGTSSAFPFDAASAMRST